ncbi:hypothetical protein ACFE04_031983 [Oxalis oulophora]
MIAKYGAKSLNQQRPVTLTRKVHTLVDQLKRCSTHKQLESICIHGQNQDMLRANVMPTSYTFSSVVKACSLVSMCGEAVHVHVRKLGFDSHLHVQTSLIDFYSNLGRIVESRKMFDEMSERDVFSWTTMVSGYARVGDLSSARRMFEMMPEKNTATWNTLIDGYARTGDIEAVEVLFKQMPVKDIISWTTMINCYSQNKQFMAALSVFDEMKRNNVNPDQVTMATVISACAHLGGLDLGKEVHFYLMQNGFDLDVYIGSALIDMYAKCGSIDKSLLMFFKLKEKNLFCWNSIIEGLAAHGYGKQALAMFKKIEKVKIRPNGVTFISVLSACTHAGLVEEGRKIFQCMSLDYCISPEVEHYGCIVDLLSRAGEIKEAFDLIKSMEFEPNSVIWGSLLSGCKLHRNLEIARMAVDQLTVLEPYNSGYYILLINMNAEVNRWGEVAKIRTIMKELGIEKMCPGSSWIEMEGKIHQFAASDTSRLGCNEIYSFLTELDGQMKLAGCIPEYASML